MREIYSDYCKKFTDKVIRKICICLSGPSPSANGRSLRSQLYFKLSVISLASNLLANEVVPDGLVATILTV
jgi:hypothetical protein